MIFNEIYSAYYNTVAKILSALTEKDPANRDLAKIVEEYAFSESILTILPSLKNERWQLVHSDMTTPIEHKPTMPMTTVQKQWLKAISLDPRIALFDVSLEGLEEVEPLFTREDYLIYDKYSDGDPYEDESYIDRFKTILTAMRQGHNLKIEMTNRRGNTVFIRCIPEKLEYSEKDDKFRLVAGGCRFVRSVNLSRITRCKAYYDDDVLESTLEEPKYETVTLEITDERNTLERCLMHFAHLEKRVERTEENKYLLHMTFNTTDTSEMVIRVLSFGPTVRVTEPESFRELIKNKLISQKSCRLL